MFASKFTALFLLSTYVSLALAAPSPSADALPSGDVVCGNNTVAMAVYAPSAVSAAVAAGTTNLKSKKVVGRYPHQFFNREAIPLACTGKTQWYEFPILSSGKIFTAPPPGPDRVIFASDGTYCAVVTHTGAPVRNGFVACSAALN